MDPVTTLTTISVGLKLVDQFSDLAKRFMGRSPEPPTQTVEQAGDVMQLKDRGVVVATRTSAELKLSEWDEIRYRTLERRIRTNWEYFNELFGEMPLLSTDERVRIKMRMENTKAELCTDFREMVRFYESVLQMPMPDHYWLREVCTSSDL